jgi:hypothetical protein
MEQCITKMDNKVKLPAHSAGPFDRAHGPEYVEWASRARSGEQDASKGSVIHIVPLNPAYPALAGRGTFRPSRIPWFLKFSVACSMQLHNISGVFDLVYPAFMGSS